MKTQIWRMLYVTGVFFAVLLSVSLGVRPGSKGALWAQRIFWTFALLWFSHSLGGIGLNAVNLAAVLCFGLPGYAAMAALSRL